MSTIKYTTLFLAIIMLSGCSSGTNAHSKSEPSYVKVDYGPCFTGSSISSVNEISDEIIKQASV